MPIMDALSSFGLVPLIALAGRILLLGFERIAVKRLGEANDPFAATVHFFGLGAVLLIPFVPWSTPLGQWLQMWPAFGAGVFYAAAFVCYVHSLSMGEASLVSPLYNANVLFLAVLAFLFLGEPLGVLKVCGLALLVYGASLLNPSGSFLKSLAAIGSDPACRYMIAASLLIACGRVADTFMVSEAGEHIDPVAYCFLLYSVIAVYVFIATAVRGRAGDVWTILRTNPVGAFLAGGINGYSYLFLLMALTRIDVSVAEPASMLSVLVTLFLARRAFGEDIRSRLVAACVMVGGAWLLLF